MNPLAANCEQLLRRWFLASPRGLAKTRAILLCLLLAVWPASLLAQSADGVVLDASELAWIEAHPIAKVGVFAGDNLPLESWVAGRAEGISVDYVRLLAQRLGLQLEFLPVGAAGTSASANEADPTYDIRLGESLTDEGAQQFSYLRPLMEGPPTMVTRKDANTLRYESDLARMRLVVERNLPALATSLSKRLPDATLLFANDGQQALDMLVAGRADVYIGSTPDRTQVLVSRRKADDVSIIAPLDLPPTQMGPAVLKEHAMLWQLLRKAEASVTEKELAQLRANWGIGEPPRANQAGGLAGLSTADREWLHRLKPLRLGYEVNRYPYTFANRSGEFDGLAADYIDLIQEQLGISIRPVPARDWPELVRMVQAGEVDMVAASMPDDFLDSGMVFSRPYERFPDVIVTRQGARASTTRIDDLAERTVALRERSGELAIIRRLLPRSRLLPMSSNEDGLAAVAAGTADAYIGTLPAVDPLIRQRFGTLQVTGQLGMDEGLAIGVAQDYAPLVPLINRVLGNMSDRQRESMRNPWLRIAYFYGVRWLWVVMGIALGVVIVSIMIYAYVRLRRLVRAKLATEKELADQLLFQQQLLEAIPYPVFVKDTEGRYMAVNRAYEVMYECDRGRLIGRTAQEAGHLSDAATQWAHELDAELIRHGDDISLMIDGEPREQDGKSSRAILLWSHRLMNSRQQVIGQLCTMVDVTDLRDAKAAAEAAVAAKGAFLATMSHEIRTPMAGVLGLIELMTLTAQEQDQRRMLGMAKDSASSLLQILDDILEVSRIESGKLVLDLQPFDLRTLVDGVVGVFSALAREKGVRLYATVDQRVAGEYRGDAGRVRQILTNLLSNAIKFTARGHVELRVDVQAETADGQSLRIAVSDTGIGIAEEHLARLFQPFTQAEASTVKRYGGSGLGLTISRQLARQMDGDIRLISAEGLGTQASFEVAFAAVGSLAVSPVLHGRGAVIYTQDDLLERGLSHALGALGLMAVGRGRDGPAATVVAGADIVFMDAAAAAGANFPPNIPVVRLSNTSDPRGLYHEAGSPVLSTHPLLWHAVRDACLAALGNDAQRFEDIVTIPSVQHRARVLVAEDHPINRAVIAHQLERLGYEHLVVEDGQQVLDALQRERFDILLTDCHMPVMDGYELTRRIREMEGEAGPRMPIIALSASVQREHVQRCRDAGMDDFVSKPVALDVLESVLSRHLELQREAALL